ncbi:hypothetical protein [Lactiplantibacillus plantarum]|uniref:hypothetical protein n=1 Tax=Lactiplantibacillus plantarum TaxID=1590 RepID=UPI0009770946|nr:hypothetical protein [Lactiplantibacillus plantarum]
MSATEENNKKIMNLSEPEKVKKLLELSKEAKETIDEINAKDKDFYNLYIEKVDYIINFINWSFSIGNMCYMLNGKNSILAVKYLCDYRNAEKEDLNRSLMNFSNLCKKCAHEIKTSGDGRLSI